MKGYITFKIKKKYCVILAIIIVLLGGFAGYTIWCAYHPEIAIQISDGPTGKANIKMEAPSIVCGGRGFAAPASAVELKLQSLASQHDFYSAYIRETCKAADIQLSMDEKDGKTTLTYTGNATTLADKKITIHEIFDFDFALDATITHK